MKNTPVTEAHRQIARCIGRGTAGEYPQEVEYDAQLIADSEAKATAELRGALALGQQNCDDVYDDLRTERKDAIARAERAEAELATERARLDWLMAGGVCMVQHTGGFHVSRLHAPVSRSAIDAAMKEDV